MTHSTLFHGTAKWLLVAVLVCFASTAKAESGYTYEPTPPGPFHQPVPPYPVEMGFTQHHSSTFAEGVQRGRAALIQAWGNYELSLSQARILSEQARWLDRENDLKYVEARHAWKEMLREARVRNRQQRDAAVAEGQKKLAVRRATLYRDAYRLSAAELDLITGQINWPVALQAAKFRHDRERVEELVRQYASYGELQPAAAAEFARCTDCLIRGLRSDSQLLTRDEYLAAQKFLRGLKCEAEFQFAGA